MLVLTLRATGNKDDAVRLQLPDGRVGWIRVVTISHTADKVRVGFEMPDDVKILRESLLSCSENEA